MNNALEKITIGLFGAVVGGILTLTAGSLVRETDKITAERYQIMQTMQYEVERARMLGVLPVGDNEYERTKSMVYGPK